MAPERGAGQAFLTLRAQPRGRAREGPTTRCGQCPGRWESPELPFSVLRPWRRCLLFNAILSTESGQLLAHVSCSLSPRAMPFCTPSAGGSTEATQSPRAWRPGSWVSLPAPGHAQYGAGPAVCLLLHLHPGNRAGRAWEGVWRPHCPVPSRASARFWGEGSAGREGTTESACGGPCSRCSCYTSPLPC